MPFRRVLLLALLTAAGATAFARLRAQRSGEAAAPPEWPPFEPTIVPSTPSPGWMVPSADGTIPDGYPVKVKISSGIFHVPGGHFYERTTADRCYPSTAAAEADGYRPSKS